MEKLFSAFEKHQYYTLKDLVHITQQPVIYLKSILKDVCIYNKKNPHKNTYELKPEYRHYKTEAEEGQSYTQNENVTDTSILYWCLFSGEKC